MKGFKDIVQCFEQLDTAIKSSSWNVVAFLWGFAEAIFFFFVPDVWLSALARNRLDQKVFRAIGCAIAGAILGGALTWSLGRFWPDPTVVLLDCVPGISPPLLARVRAEVDGKGLLAFAVGPTRGVPYKIYAAQWGMNDGNLALMALVSIPVRGARFLLVTVVTRWISSLAEKRVTGWNRKSFMVLCLFWAGFYLCYFAHFGW